ncbi:MAG: energy transducer TonB [Sphingomicrobium sp.]
MTKPGDRWRSIAAVAGVHFALAFALLHGLSVPVQRSADAVTQLIVVRLLPPPPLLVVEPKTRAAASSAAPIAARDRPGGATGPSIVRVANPVAAIVAIAPTVSPGGSSGYGPLTGSGSGGGTGGPGTGNGNGNGNGDGGSDLELISGEIRQSDYPQSALRAGIGGRVEFRFTVGVTGRVTACTVTRSSGDAGLDALTCRLIMQRFHYRPSTDAAGRPIAAEVEGDQIWSTNRRDFEPQN